jgi:putative transposase
MKNVLCLENHYFPGELEQEIERFVHHYNNHRVHESLDNLTPADVYGGRGAEILTMRQLVKEQTLRRRRRENLGLTPLNEEPVKPQLLRECVA